MNSACKKMFGINSLVAQKFIEIIAHDKLNIFGFSKYGSNWIDNEIPKLLLHERQTKEPESETERLK